MSKWNKVDPSKMKQLAESTQGGGGDFGEWLKLTSGVTQLRITPPWSDEGSPYRKLINHNGPFNSPFMTPEGKRVAPLCLRYVFASGNEHLFEICEAGGKLSGEDKTLFEEFGCPLCHLPQNLMATGNKDAANQHWPRTQFIWNVIKREDGKLYKWSCSKKIATPIEATFNLYPALFDPKDGRDFQITATGEGKNRRYEAPVFMPTNSDLAFEGNLNNLDDAMLIGVRGFDELVSLVVNNNTIVPNETKLNADLLEYAVAKGIIE
jgi:hypothetical protein